MGDRPGHPYAAQVKKVKTLIKNYPNATLTKRNGNREWRIHAGNEMCLLAFLAYCALLDFASFRFVCIALLALLCWHCFALLCLLSIASRGIANCLALPCLAFLSFDLLSFALLSFA